MSANEGLVQLATEQFMTDGLGGRLSRNGRSINPVAPSIEPMYKAASTVCGNIAERVLWCGLGWWLGCFQQVEAITIEEKVFLAEHSQLLQEEAGWPAQYQYIFSLLLDANTNTGPGFFEEQLRGSNVASSIDVFPVFQAAHAISESLTEDPVSFFFLFLREGDIADFIERSPSPNEIFRALESSEQFSHSTWSFQSPAAVVAGFIRYTEFLTAMDSLFPADYMRKHGMERTSVLESMRNREALAEEIKEIIRWRIPNTSRGLMAYQTVRTTFLQIVSDHFHQQPNFDLQWAPVGTYTELIRLADRFFGLKERVQAKAAEAEIFVESASGPETPADFAQIGESEIFGASQAPDDDDDEPRVLGTP
jgi:hypothetical protein